MTTMLFSTDRQHVLFLAAAAAAALINPAQGWTISAPITSLTTAATAAPTKSHHDHHRSLVVLGATGKNDKPSSLSSSSPWDEGISRDSNRWRGMDEDTDNQADWLDVLNRQKEGTFWSSFESDPGTETDDAYDYPTFTDTVESGQDDDSDVDAEAWLDTLAAISAQEVEFNQKEAERAEMARKMQEYKFSPEIIASTLGVATDLTLEEQDEVKGMREYREKAYKQWDDVNLETVESHTQVEMDTETGEPIRSQMVYVDEHTCIGCTNCAMIAQSTFFMHSEHGRARVFQQWGDDDETIQVAIETCPVDCIHYVPYDELVRLEKDRRNQNINFKARLVSQAEYGGLGSSHLAGGKGFTAPQQISGNMGSRCSNCPSRGCANCPMYGVGKNPEFEKREKARKARLARRELQQERAAQQKIAEL